MTYLFLFFEALRSRYLFIPFFPLLFFAKFFRPTLDFY